MTYLAAALDIDELEVSLRNISEDDKREVSSYSQKEIVDEAKWVLSVYYESGTISNERLNGEWGAFDKKAAQTDVKKLKAFIKKYDA